MFKLQPVAWFTGLVTTLVAVDGAAEAAHVLSPTVAAWAGIGIAGLTALLGFITHGVVTPVAAPKDSSGRPLVPLNR